MLWLNVFPQRNSAAHGRPLLNLLMRVTTNSFTNFSDFRFHCEFVQDSFLCHEKKIRKQVSLYLYPSPCRHADNLTIRENTIVYQSYHTFSAVRINLIHAQPGKNKLFIQQQIIQILKWKGQSRRCINCLQNGC